MAAESRNVKLVCSPFRSTFEFSGNLIFSVSGVAYTQQFFSQLFQSVTIKVKPFNADYLNTLAEDVREMMLKQDTAETQVLNFDLKNNRSRTTQIGDGKVEIKLMNIGAVEEKGQKVPVFDFSITVL